MGQQTTAPAPLPQVSNPNSPNRGFNLAKIKQELPDRDDGIGSMSQTEASIRIKVEPPDESEQGRTVDHSAQHRAFMLKSIKEEPLDEQSTQAMPVLGGIGHGSGGDGVSALTVRLTDMTRSAPPPNCALDMFDEQQIPHIAHSFPTGPSRGERYLPNNSGIGGLKTVPHFDGSLPSSFDQEKLRRLEEEDRLKDEYQRKMKKNEELERRKHIEEKKRKEGRARDIMRDRLRESEEREERRKNLTDEERNKEDEKRRKEEDKNRKKKEEERERRRKEREEMERRKKVEEEERRKEEERKLRAQNSEESGDVSTTKSAVKKKKTAERTVSADSSDMPQRKRGKNHDQSESSRKLAEPVKKKKKMISDSSEDEGTVDETTSSAVPLPPPAPITERNSSSTSSLPPSSSKNSLPPPPSKTFGQKDKTANHSSGMQLGWNGSAASVGRIPKKAKNSADSQISPPSRTSMLSRPTVLPSSSTHSIAPSMKHPETFTPTSVQKKNSCERQRVGASHAGGNQGGTIDAANRRGSDMATEKRPSRVKQPRSKLKDMTGLDTPMDAITRDMNKGHAKSSTTPLAAHPVEKRVKFDSVGGPSTSFQSYASGGVQYADGRSNAYGADRSPCGRSPSDRSSSSFGSPSASPLTEGGMSPPLHPPPSRAVPPPPSSSTSCLQTVTPASSRARPAPSEEDLMCFSSDRPRPPIPTRARVGSHRGDHYLLTDDSSDGSSRSCSYTSNAAPAAPAAAPPPEIPSAPIHIPHSPTINRPEEPEIHAGSTAEKPAMGQPDEPSRPAAVAAAATPAATLNHVAATVATSVPAAAATEAATTTILAATPAVTVNPAAATAIPKPSAAVATTSRPHAASWMPDLKTIHAAAAAPQQATAARSDPRLADPRRRPTGAVPTVAPTAAANIQPQKQPRPVPPPAAADAAIPPPVVVPTQAVVASQRVAPPPVIAPPPDAAVAWVPIRGDPRGGAALPPGWDKTLTELLQWEEKNRRTIRGYAFTVAVDEDSLGLKPIQRLAAFKRATTHVDSMEKRNGNGERDDKLCRSFRCLNHGFNAEYNDLRPKHWMIPLVRARSLSPPPFIPTPPTMRRQPPPAPVQPPVQENHDTPLFTLRPTARRDDDEGPSTYTSNLPPGMDDGIMPIRPPPRQRVKEKEPLWRLKERQEMQRKIAVEMAEKEAENREKARRIIQKRTIVEEFSEKTVIDLEEWKRRENERNAFGDHERDRREYERRDHEGETGDQRRSMDEEAERRARRDQVEEERRQRQARTAKKTEIAQGFQQQLPVSTAAPRHSAGMNPLGWTASNGVSFPSSASSSSTPIPPALSNVDNPVRPTSRSSNEENTLPSSSSTPSESLKNVVMEYARRRAQEKAMEIKPASTSSAHPPLQLPQQSQSYQPPPYQSVPPPLAPSVPDAPRPPHLPCFVYDPSGNMVPYPLDLPYDRPPPDPSTMHLQGYPINPTPDTIPLPATRREGGEGENGEEPMEVEEQGNDPEPATNGMENGRREEEDRPGPSNVTPVLVQLGDEESDEEDDEIPPPNMQLFGSHLKRRADWQPTTYNEDARTVIVSGNIKDTNEEDLRQLFSRFGRIDVIETYCMFKNFATARFIRYKKLKSANAAVTGEILELNNRKISVNHYLKRPKPD